MSQSLFLYTSAFSHSFDNAFWDSIRYSYSPDNCCLIVPTVSSKIALERQFQTLTFYTLDTAPLKPSLFFCGFWSLDHRAPIEALLAQCETASFLVFYEAQNPLYQPAEAFVSWIQTKEARHLALPSQASFVPKLYLSHPPSITQEIQQIGAFIEEKISQGVDVCDIGIAYQDPLYTYWISKCLASKLKIRELTYPLSHSLCVAHFLEGIEASQAPLSLSLYQACFKELPHYPSEAERSAWACLKQSLPTLPCHTILTLKTALKKISHHVSNPFGIELMPYAPLTPKKTVFLPGLLEEALDETEKKNHTYALFAAMFQAETLYISYPPHPWETAAFPSSSIQKFCHYLGITPHILNSVVSEASPSIKLEKPPIKSLSDLFHVDIKAKSWSVTELETFQNCPQQYFYRYILKEKPPEPEEDISALEWGTWIHALLEKWRQHPHYQTAPRESLFALAHQLIPHHSFAWEVKKRLLFGEEGLPLSGLLQAILTEESENPLPFTPVAFEKNFEAIPLTNTMLIRGKIDVILASQTSHFLAVMDYKTGSTLPSGADLKHFRSLQLPFYLLAASKLYPDYTLAGGILYHIKNDYQVEKNILCITPEAKETKVFDLQRKRPFIADLDFFSAFKAHLVKLTELIQQGHFSPDSEEILPHTHGARSQHCEHCPYRYTCTYSKRFS